MSKVIVISIRETGHVLAAATRNLNPDDAIDADQFVGNGLTVRTKARLVGLALPANAENTNIAHHGNIYFDPDDLSAHLVDEGHNVMRAPRQLYVKTPDESPALAVVQAAHQITLGAIQANGDMTVTIPQDAFSQQPEIVVWGRATGGGNEVNATPVTAEPEDPPANVDVPLNFGPLQVNTVYTVIVFAGSLPPAVRRQNVT